MQEKKKIGLVYHETSIGAMELYKKAIEEWHLKDQVMFEIIRGEDELQKEVSLDAAYLDYFLTKEERIKFMTSHPSIKWVHIAGAGIDKLFIPQIMDNPSVTLTNGKGLFDQDLASLVMGGILHFNLNFPYYLEQKKQKNWKKYFGDSIVTKTAGIIGMGSIGGQIAKKLKLGLEMKVLGIRKSPEKTTAEVKQYLDQNLGLESLEKVLSLSDFVICILPFTQDNVNFFDEKKFQMMKKTAIFINIGRGQTVNDDELIAALKSKTIGGALLDVFNDDYLSPDSEFWEFQNVLITMHSGGMTKHGFSKAPGLLLKNVEHFIKGEALENVVDKSKGY